MINVSRPSIYAKNKQPRKNKPVKVWASSLKFVLASFGCISLALFVCCHSVMASNMETVKQFSVFYNSLFSGIHTRGYEMSTRANLMYLVEAGTIKTDILADTFPEVSNFSAYLSNVSCLARTSLLDRSLLIPKHPVLSLYAPLLSK